MVKLALRLVNDPAAFDKTQWYIPTSEFCTFRMNRVPDSSETKTRGSVPLTIWAESLYHVTVGRGFDSLP